MDRTILYSQEQFRTFDFTSFEHDVLTGLGYSLQDLLGSGNSVVAGFAATQTATPSRSINLAAGRAYQLASADATSQGTIPQDLTQIVMQGMAAAQTVTLSTTGIAAGQSRWALIQAQFNPVDVVRSGDPNGGVMAFYNASNPSSPLNGQGGSGGVLPTVRQGVVSISVVTGAAATTGSETPPSPTSGWMPLYLIDLTYGQTAITNAQIKVAGPSVGTGVSGSYPVAPFLTGLTNSHHAGTNGQAPQIKLASEVQGVLPLANLVASGIRGGLSAVQTYAGNPNGFVAGNAATGGLPPDLCWDSVNKLVWVCTTTGTTSTAVWTQPFAGTFSSGGAGWAKIPMIGLQNLIIQWGGGTFVCASAGVTTTAFTLLMAYPTSHMFALANYSGTSPPAAGSVAASPSSASQITVSMYSPGATSYGFTYLSIGY